MKDNIYVYAIDCSIKKGNKGTDSEIIITANKPQLKYFLENYKGIKRIGISDVVTHIPPDSASLNLDKDNKPLTEKSRLLSSNFESKEELKPFTLVR